MFLNCSFHHVSLISPANMLEIQIGFLPAAGSKLGVLKHSFAQEIFVTLLQHRVMFFNKNLQLHLHLKPSLKCSLLVLNFWANLSFVVLIKLFLYKKSV